MNKINKFNDKKTGKPGLSLVFDNYYVRVNNQITAEKVRLITDSGDNKGVVTIDEALFVARQSNLDLIEISGDIEIPVCKVMDFGKYKYNYQKKLNESKKNQKIVEVKELKLRPQIEKHDYEVKIKAIEKWIKDGDKVKLMVVFRGREIAFQEFGVNLIERIRQDTESYAKFDSQPKLDKKQIHVTIVPK